MTETSAPRLAEVLIDGTLSRPQLDHPKGLAVAPDGTVYCGGEQGQVYRVAPDASSFVEIARFDGFSLGMALLGDDIVVCDLRNRVVWRVDPESGAVELFTNGGDRPFRTPNMVAVAADGAVYVSDSGSAGVPGPGIYRFDARGNGGLWAGTSLNFANGIAVDEASSRLVVVESFAPGLTAIPILSDGSPGVPARIVDLPGMVPDGVAVGPDGMLYVGCYEPSRVLRVDPARERGRSWLRTSPHMCSPIRLMSQYGGMTS